MPYLGISPNILAENNLTNVQLIDDLSSQFNGSTTTFNLTSSGEVFHTVAARAIFIVLGGVVQDPSTDYSTSGSQITFTTAPQSGLSFAGRKIYGLNEQQGVNDGTVTPAKLNSGGPSWDISGNTNIDGNLTVDGGLTIGSSATVISSNHDFPTIRPTLDLNFAATKTLDRRITFTRDSIGTFINENGIVKYASNNVPRFDHDPTTGESLGLLIEESRTNLFPYGKTPGSNWSGAIANSTFTENTTEVTAPDGTNTATKWEFTAGDPYLYHQHTLLANTTYTMSIWVKAGTNMSGDAVQFRIGASPYSSSAESTLPTDGSWKRLTFTKTIGGSNETNVNVGFEPQTLPGLGSPAIGDVVYIWGAQLEIGSFVTSLIPTSGSTVTRAADLASITGTNFTNFYNSTEGSLYSDFSLTGLDAAYNSTTVMITNNTTTNYLAIFGHNPVIPYAITGGSQQFSASLGGSSTTGVNYKSAMAFKLNDFAASLNGGTVSTDTSATIPPADRMLIGRRVTQNKMMNGHIRAIKYYTKRLPNAQLQGLTQQ